MTFTTWNHRGTGLLRAAVLLGLATSVTLPAAAQLGPASKKVRGMTGRPAAESPSATPTVAATGGTVVLTDEVLVRFTARS